MKLSKLASEIVESPTLALNEEARLLRERGEAVINLGIGEPKNKTPIAAILASASVNAVQCYEQYFLGFAETIEQYEAGKEDFWAKQGVDLNSTTVDAFERRLRAREASGFFAHSNVAGAYAEFRSDHSGDLLRLAALIRP